LYDDGGVERPAMLTGLEATVTDGSRKNIRQNGVFFFRDSARFPVQLTYVLPPEALDRRVTNVT
jgi:hypothetical protein